MNVTPLYTNAPTFQSRNKTIRFADDISRRVNQCFPMVSSTKIKSFKSIKKFSKYCKCFSQPKIILKRIQLNELYEECNSVPSKLIAIVKSAIKFKSGNCGEQTQLAAIVAQVNGIKDCHIANLCTTNGRDLDHSVLFVNDKQPYIIDAWCGFADYVPNAITKYENEYGNIFKLRDKERMTFVASIEDSYTDDLKENFSRGQLNKVLKLKPSMKIEKY